MPEASRSIGGAAMPPWERAIVGIGIATGLFGAVLYAAQRDSLWEDEIIALTHGLEPLATFFVEVLRNDIHPFAYFLLLKGWAAVAPGSDRWLLASSFAAALASAASLAWVAHRVGGPRAAWWAAALFCVLPNFAWAGGNLRMYGLTPGLAVLFWYASRRCLLEGGRAMWLWAIALELLLAYTHAIQFYFIAFIVAAVAFEKAWHVPIKRLTAWLGVQAAVALCLLPLAGSALLRGTEPLTASSLQSLWSAPAQLFTGWALAEQPVALAAGALLFAVLFGLALLQPTGRALALVAVAAPLLVATAIGFLGKPMMKPPVFTASLVPFLVLAAAAGLASSTGRAAVACAAALLLVTSAVTVPWSQRLLPAENFGPAGRFIAQQARPGDVVVVPRVSVFWGVLRYAVGPQWGSPLATMPPSNEAWSRLQARLGPAWTERLGLRPGRDHVIAGGVRYVLGTAAGVDATAAGARIWVVHRHRYADTVRLSTPAAVRGTTWFGGELAVSRLEPDAAGALAFSNPLRPGTAR